MRGAQKERETEMYARELRRIWKAVPAILLVALLLGNMVGLAEGEELEFASEYGIKYLITDSESMIPVDIINFKARLRELGFYVAGVDDATLQSRQLDDLTMAAVREVCRLNPELAYHERGVSNLMYWWVMGEGGFGADLKTPLDDRYRRLHLGEQGSEVTEIQNRLEKLGYGAAGYEFTPGVYDEALQGAMELFAQSNNLSVDAGDEITVELQERLFSEDAVAYVPQAGGAALGATERILQYFSAKSTVLGLSLPNGVLWAIGFVLVCVIVILLFKLFSPEEKSAKADAIKPGEICFTIEYGGESCVYRDTLKHYVRIGRATDQFPLNLADTGISRKHCEIYSKEGKLFLRDFSRNGTKVNGAICRHAEQILHSGDVLGVGNHKITLRYER